MSRRDRKPVMFHNVRRTCGNCDRYIYEGQNWTLVPSGGNTSKAFHTDYLGCIHSGYLPEIRIGTRKGKVND